MRKPATGSSPIALGPALPDPSNADAIDVERLRAVLSPVPSRTQFAADDGVADEELTPASVLFPIVLREAGPAVLLTQRTEHLRDHPGQISFPGGRVEADDTSPAHTALREAQEEIGLSAAHIEIIGYLPEYRTGTGFRVTPVVALVRPPFELRPDPVEVAGIFEVPLAFLMDFANHQQHSAHSRGKLRHYFAMPYGDYFIWGATAGIIVTLARALAG
jgi:8-oxo-dGTP pyrophosphatase MutT (NUDIX family)